ncbi:MAG: THUMP domain-containing protein [Bacteroidales bacterium]
MKFTAKTLYGLEKVLAGELEELGASDIEPANRAVLFSGTKELLYKVNYCSRSALSFLVPLSGFRIRSKEDLYKKASEIEWSEIMDQDSSFSVAPVVRSDIFDHSGYPALIVKDAIADHFRGKTGRRPSVNTADPDVVINLHISNNHADLSLDSSVIPLYKRGYRAEQGLAPLNEVLAAGMLMLAGWDGTLPLQDPMCGSGTLIIEARLMADKIPPGKFRPFFGFTRWKDFDESLFNKVKKESEAQIINSGILVTGSDISEAAVRQAEANIRKAGLEGEISIGQSDFRDARKASDNGYLIMNPPYGQRLKPDENENLYSMIGTILKHHFAGNKAWIITSGKEYLKNIGLRPRRKYTLFNGALECVFAGYELYEGTKKQTSLKSP